MHFLPQQPKTTRYSSPAFQRHKLNAEKYTKNYKQKRATKIFYDVRVKEVCKLKYYTLSGLRLLISRIVEKKDNLNFHASFKIPLTSKPGLRMGTGKGKIKTWVSEFKRGQILLTFADIGGKRTVKRLIKLLNYKLPIKVAIVERK